MTQPYIYQAEIIRWVDGDTVDLRVDQGFRQTMTDRFRLYGVDAPERGQPLHDEATAFCTGAAPAGTTVTVRTHMDQQDKYGRWLAEILLTERSLNDALIAAGLAVPYFGGHKGGTP